MASYRHPRSTAAAVLAVCPVGAREQQESGGILTPPDACHEPAPGAGSREETMAWEMPGLAGRPLTIDSHAHINPPRWSHATGAAIRPFDLDALFREQDAAGVNLTVFS